MSPQKAIIVGALMISGAILLQDTLFIKDDYELTLVQNGYAYRHNRATGVIEECMLQQVAKDVPAMMMVCSKL